MRFGSLSASLSTSQLVDFAKSAIRMGATPSGSVSSVERPGDLCATRSGDRDGRGGDFGRHDADFVGTLVWIWFAGIRG